MHVFSANIGLKIPGSNEVMQPEPVLAVLKSHFSVLDQAVVQSDSEPTLSVVCAAFNSEADVLRHMHLISIALGQEAIAVWFGGWGDLVGPFADRWGRFNPAFFITPGGARLSDILEIGS